MTAMGRSIMPLLAFSALATLLCSVVPAQDAYGPWEVRRGRTVDWETAGGYPTWQVTFSGPEDKPDVVIDGDDGKARGTILIGRRVTLPEDSLVGLDFAYTTVCELEDRCGRLEIVMIRPEAWDELGTEPAASVAFNSGDRATCLALSTVHSHVGADVEEPARIDATQSIALGASARAHQGEEVVIAVAWTGLHGQKESATVRGVELTQMAPGDSTRLLFDRLDLDRADLSAVKAAVTAENFEAAAAALAEHFRTRAEPEFPGDPRLREDRSTSASKLNEADAALENRFTGQSKYGLQKVPDTIDWSFNPTKDPEWTWQFNRHSAWGALADAYLATGDEKYAEKWVALMDDWVLANPPGTPWSWRTLEAGIRGMGWIPVYLSFLEWPGFRPVDQATFLRSLSDHAEYLLPSSRFHSGSNWGQTESLGLLYIGSFFPEFKDAATWRDTAWKRLEDEMFRQVYEDGAQVELTTSYHQGTISGFIRAADIARLGGAEPSGEYWQRLERMYEYTMFLQKPDGTQPMLGDSWPGNTRGTVRAGAVRFERSDMLYVASAGKEGERPDYLDTQLPDAGYYVMRTDWVDPQALYMLVDVAHHWGGGHQQPDALQVNLYAYGKTLLPDSGSYLYYGPERAKFARTSSHSTVTIDGANQNTSAAKLNSRFSSDGLSFVDGSHTGYKDVTHRRQVLFARPRGECPAYFIVIDRVTGEGEHTADQYFHFAPAPLQFDADEFQARTTAAEGANLLIRAVRTDDLEFAQVDSEVSFVYTEKEPRPAIRYRHGGQLPATFVTLLLPYPGAEAPEVTVRELPLGGAQGLIGVQVEGKGFRDVVFAAEEPGPVSLEGVKAPARAGLIRFDSDGKPLQVDVVQ